MELEIAAFMCGAFALLFTLFYQTHKLSQYGRNHEVRIRNLEENNAKQDGA